MSRHTPKGARQDARLTRQSADTERVLGQIERGEVRAGRDAAREIAAKAEAAYGATWARPAASVHTLRPEPTTVSGADAA